MKNSILLKLFIQISSVVIIFIWIIFYIAGHEFETNFINFKKKELFKILYSTEPTIIRLLEKPDKIDQYIHEISLKTQTRFTVINLDGKVVIDSDKDSTIMENHKTRPEVVDAINNGMGSSIRFSNSVGYNMLYTAIFSQTENENYILRCSIYLNLLENAITEYKKKIFIAAILINILAIILLYFFSRRISRPIIELTSATKVLAEGNFDVKINVEGSDEIASLGQNFLKMAETIQKNFEELKDKKKELIASVSHELRTPLTAIKGFLETMREEVTPRGKEYLSIAERQTDRLSQIVKDLLILSELESGIEPLHENVILNNVIHEAINLLIKKAHQKELNLHFKENSKVTLLNGDSFKLEQLFINLIDNAIKYTETGGVEIVLGQNETFAFIEIKDTGIGIPEADISKIFERFYVVNKARSRKTGGTGLGLSIAKHVVLIHRGNLEVSSSPGKGTSVFIKLPLK